MVKTHKHKNIAAANAKKDSVAVSPTSAPAAAIVDTLRNSWFLIIFVGTVIYLAAKHDSSLTDIKRIDARETTLEGRVSTLESGLGQVQSKLDAIKEDVTLIKSAVIKNPPH